MPPGKWEIRLFGEVELRAAGHVLDMGAPRRQAVFAALVVDAGRPVAIETLIDRVWDENPPIEARNVLYSHLSRIRRLLGQAVDLGGEPVVRLERRHAGYVLGIDPDLVDLHRFCRLVEYGCGSRCGDADRVGVLAEALGLWRGPPLAAVSGRWAAQVRSSWQERRLDGVVRWAEAVLRLDNPTAVITVLHDLVAEYPLVEPLEALLMRGLHAAGRGAEAIDRYATLRQRLADDLGTDPGPEIRALHEAILRGEQPRVTRRGPLEGLTDTFVSPHIDPLTDFVGRESELDALHTLLTGTTERAPVTGVLTGMGGVGKSSLARAYARRHRADYGVVWWIRAEEHATIDGDFRTLLEILAPHDAGQIRDAVAAVHALLADQPRPWLVVLDNVPNVAAARGLVPPAGTGHVLITSQATAHWPPGQTVMAVEPLTQQASIDLLTSLSMDDDRGTAQVLAKELGGVPLALTQAGAFARAGTVTLSTYLRLYRDRRTELHQEGQPPDYPHTVATTWQLAFDRLTSIARALLNVLCFYAPDAIPVQLLLTPPTRAESVPEPLRVLLDDELARLRAVGELLAYSLLSPVRATTTTLSMHRLVQAVTRDQLQDDTREWLKTAHLLLTAAFPAEPFTVITMTTPHHLARDLFAELSLAQRQLLGADHPDTLATRDSLARRTSFSGDTAGARDLYNELLAARQRVLGPEHPDTLATYYNLSLFTGQSGDYPRARDLCADLVARQQRVLGPEHPDTLATRSRLAYWTGQAGDVVGARDLATELLVVQERVLGADHLDTVVGRYNAAFWTGKAVNPTALHDVYPYLRPIQEQIKDAEDRDPFRHDIPYWPGQEFDIAITRAMLTDLLPAAKRTLGAEHPDTLNGHHNLARWSGYTGDITRARDLYAELLTIRERVLGTEHPDTLTTRHNLAYWTGLAGAPATARDQTADLLAIRERVLGTEHPHTLTTRHNLAHWTAKSGDITGACDLFATLLPVRKRVLGPEHPDTLTTGGHLAYWTQKHAAV
jgi:DNA-binding SARP family transcriptional activator